MINDPKASATRTLEALGGLQGVMATKARFYKESNPELAARFVRASFAAVNARMLMQAALMAERESAI